jgi:hypothetical protein
MTSTSILKKMQRSLEACGTILLYNDTISIPREKSTCMYCVEKRGYTHGPHLLHGKLGLVSTHRREERCPPRVLRLPVHNIGLSRLSSETRSVTCVTSWPKLDLRLAPYASQTIVPNWHLPSPHNWVCHTRPLHASGTSANYMTLTLPKHLVISLTSLGDVIGIVGRTLCLVSPDSGGQQLQRHVPKDMSRSLGCQPASIIYALG